VAAYAADAVDCQGMGGHVPVYTQPVKGIEPMTTAFQLYSDPLKKGDAARVLGIMYYKTDRKQEALEMFQKADSLSPAYHPNQMFLLRSQLQMGQDKPALELAGVIFDQAPVDPDVPDELLEMFRIEGEGELLATLFSNLLQQYRHNPEANGNIRFHYGKLLYLEGYHKKAVKMFRKSKKQFQKTLPRDHHVFKMLDDMIEKINEQG
jgi:tetratricopeptide (TPR) repeat protein